MLIGAHVSPAGGVASAVQRGVERGCRSIQIFNQNPRAWKPRDYQEADIEAFRAAMQATDVDALLIHAVYLLNPASDDVDIRAKTLASLQSSLRAGARLGAAGVVLHPGSAKGGEVAPAIARAGALIREALAESDGCPLHLENTAGAGGTLGRSLDELAALVDAVGSDRRVGLCLDSCHLLASGFEVRDAASLGAVLDQCDAKVGLERLGSLHLNDSQEPLGSNRDRHANVGAGQLGEEGCATFLSEPRFDGLPCVLETPTDGRDGQLSAEVALAGELRERGRRARGLAQP
ncbi:MAG: deoxyribonuclease IV [Solirubrobacterales bacterium]|nr:deoxyribonuclease IV [Solirubrobacterales bacterium]